jgi:hypothetical protein
MFGQSAPINLFASSGGLFRCPFCIDFLYKICYIKKDGIPYGRVYLLGRIHPSPSLIER